MDKEQPKRKKVAIVGFAPSWNLAPFKDESFEIWGLNELYKYFSQMPDAVADRWFEIHSPDSPSKNTPEHRKWLAECPIPVYMQEHFDDIPNSIEYPRKEIKEYFGKNFIVDENGAAFTDYSNSISWMIALAIYEGFEEIHVYGVDMAQKSEYAWQRSSCQYFLGYAAGKGIKLLIPKTSELCKFPQDYGWETDNQPRLKKRQRKKELTERKKFHTGEIQKAQQLIAQHQAALQQLNGAIGEIDYDLNNHIV